jgi:hypothetical protein
MGKKKTLEAKVAPSKLPRRADVIAVTSDEGDDLEKTTLLPPKRCTDPMPKSGVSMILRIW